ncbi:hypothetical protein [Candidatus Amarobacter glycogenicus]|uniref:hypothetical protein n=1 Tax=Candidatus Amarobacter glycogenicus TaxID=3140699 RepID=UPI002A0E0221|nr:hypothetical protein [Dehalococcoidia bacterium]
MKRTVSSASEARRKVDRLRALRSDPAQLHDLAMEVLADEGSPELVKLALESLGETVRPSDGPVLRDVYAYFAASGPKRDPSGPVRVEALRALWHLRSADDRGMAIEAARKFESGVNGNGEMIRAAGLALLGVLDPERAAYAAAWAVASGDANEFSGEPSLTAVRLLAALGETRLLLALAIAPSTVNADVTAEAIRSLAPVPMEYLESVFEELSGSENEAIIVALADLASSLPASPSVTHLVGDLLSRAPQPEVYAFLASTIVASRRPELVGVLIESLPREMSQKRLRSALEALRLAPKDAGVCQHPGSPSLPQQLLRVRAFRQLLRSSIRSFVPNEASYSRQLETALPRLGRRLLMRAPPSRGRAASALSRMKRCRQLP